MSYFKIGNKLITASMYDILSKLKEDTGFPVILQKKSDSVAISCPFHSGGREEHPSCFVHDDYNSDRHGIFNCFACHESGTIINIIAQCFEKDVVFATEWLNDNFADVFVEELLELEEISFNNSIKVKYLDESILDEYSYFHPYVFNRGISEEVVRKFRVGCTPDGQYITFPCWDEHDKLIGIFKRSTTSKEFIIPKNIDKPIYLLNFILKENIDSVYVVESQFNALTLWTWGYPAICLFGTGTKSQYDILNKSGIRNYKLCFDGDSAGDKGRDRFMKYIKSDSIVDIINIPRGKDVNDLTKDFFDTLLK